jgi:hypothetical protein
LKQKTGSNIPDPGAQYESIVRPHLYHRIINDDGNVEGFVSPEDPRMSNRRSFPCCAVVAMPGVVDAAALEFERSTMRVSLENSVHVVSVWAS